MDVTPLDNSKTKKESVSRTYKDFEGYASMMAYKGNVTGANPEGVSGY